MFREIRTSERITDTSVTSTNYELMRLLDKRISEKTIEEIRNIRNEERKVSKFDPDKRI